MSVEYHPSVTHILVFFDYEHLPDNLQVVSEPFAALAHEIAARFGGQGAELTVALRKLLEAKDAAVRQAVFQAPSPSAA